MGTSAGRPSIEISKDDILFLKGLDYSWTKIASILGISRSTLYRRLEEFNIDSNAYTDITESQLLFIIIIINALQCNIQLQLYMCRWV